MTPYQERTIAQTRRWVEGDCKHNMIDDECCPDFSCCMPELFIQDRWERKSILSELLHKYRQDQVLDS